MGLGDPQVRESPKFGNTWVNLFPPKRKLCKGSQLIQHSTSCNSRLSRKKNFSPTKLHNLFLFQGKMSYVQSSLPFKPACSTNALLRVQKYTGGECKLVFSIARVSLEVSTVTILSRLPLVPLLSSNFKAPLRRSYYQKI